MARATRESMLVLEAAGYDVVIVETVGVGQNEIAVSEMVDTFLLLTLARAGDQLQGIKRGILELADVITVNKADGDGEAPARGAARELAGAMRMMMPGPSSRRPPVLTCSALTGPGSTRCGQRCSSTASTWRPRGRSRCAAHASSRTGCGRWSTPTCTTRCATPAACRRSGPRSSAPCAPAKLSAVDGTARILDLYAADLRARS